MPWVSRTAKERVELEYQLVTTLEAKCNACKLFFGIKPDNIYIYTVHNNRSKEPIILAFAQFNSLSTYAVYAPEQLSEIQLTAFDQFVNEVKLYAEEGERIVVFSQENYDAIMKYNYGKPMNVILYV